MWVNNITALRHVPLRARANLGQTLVHHAYLLSRSVLPYYHYVLLLNCNYAIICRLVSGTTAAFRAGLL